MNRREFSRMMAGAAVSAMLPAPLLAQAAAGGVPRVSPAAAELYRRALVLDCNAGPPYEGGRLPLPQADLDLVRDSGVNVVKWSIGGSKTDFAETVKYLAYVQQMIEVHAAYFLQVRVAGDLQRAKSEGKMGIIFSFESADMLEDKLERFEIFRDLGVRVMQFSYNRKSAFGAGVLEPEGGGLTALGHEALQRMNALGIAVDLSHANPQTTRDALAGSSRPVIMSHAACAAVHPHVRNKTDEQLRALADKGGVMGIYDLPFLTAPPRQPTVDDYMAHVEHALKVAGEDHVGVGSDGPIQPFDTSPAAMAEYEKFLEQRRQAGVAAPEEDRPAYVVGMNTPRRIEVIVDQMLKRGHPARVAEKVAGANFARVFGEIWA